MIQTTTKNNRRVMDFLRKTIILLCLLFNVGSSFADGLYFKHKDLRNYFDQYKELPKPLPDYLSTKIEVEISLILDQNPDAYDEIVENLKDVHNSLKPFIIQGIVNIKGQDVAINKDFNLSPKPALTAVNNAPYIFPSDTINAFDANPIITDYFWWAYYVTGNKDYLMRIITFLSKFSKEVKSMSVELDNTRILDATQSKLGVKSSLEKEFLQSIPQNMLFEVVNYNIIEGSLSSNMGQYPEIKEVVEQIFKEHPELDIYKIQN